MKIYLSGQMSGITNHNFPAFHKAAKSLRDRGWEVISPAELDEALPIENGTWGQYLARDLLVIADDGIEGMVFLPDWYLSRGARTEAAIGLNLRKDFCFFELNRDNALANVGRKYVAKNIIYWSV